MCSHNEQISTLRVMRDSKKRVRQEQALVLLLSSFHSWYNMGETWAPTVEDISRITRNENMMLRWICGVRLADQRRMSDLRSLLSLQDINTITRWGRLRWYGHIQRMDDDKWPKKIFNLQVPGKYPSWPSTKVMGRKCESWHEAIKYRTLSCTKPNRMAKKN